MHNTWAIIATGESVTQEDADYLKGKCKVIAVSNSYKLAPWADVLASYDAAWWRHNPEASSFVGAKYCWQETNEARKYRPDNVPVGCNSGLFSMFIARDFGAERILLLGVDMQGTHFFGKHPEPLKNTRPIRFQQHINQFRHWNNKIKVINCNPNSALKKFPFANLRDVI